eukprot:02014_6
MPTLYFELSTSSSLFDTSSFSVVSPGFSGVPRRRLKRSVISSRLTEVTPFFSIRRWVRSQSLFAPPLV